MPKLTDEDRIVQMLSRRCGVRDPAILCGIGDDAAVIRASATGEVLLITTDMLLEGVDFRQEWTTPRRLGRKAIAVNMSDLAAMGGRPRFFTVSLAIPVDTGERWIREFYDGLADPIASCGAKLVGGDLSGSERGIVISITAVGESVKRKVLYRSGGRPGDLLYVTGTLGRSAAGLELLRTGRCRARSRSQREALDVHHCPEPRCRVGQWLAASGMVRCMMDMSDGLSVDLPRMCAACGADAEIRLKDIPVFSASRDWNCDPLEMALHGGEDYELLFAVPQSRSHRLEKLYPSDFPGITCIGSLIPGAGAVWTVDTDRRRRLARRGYDHFRVDREAPSE